MIEYSPKKKTDDVVDVWRNITVRELAKAAELSVGEFRLEEVLV